MSDRYLNNGVAGRTADFPYKPAGAPSRIVLAHAQNAVHAKAKKLGFMDATLTKALQAPNHREMANILAEDQNYRDLATFIGTKVADGVSHAWSEADWWEGRLQQTFQQAPADRESEEFAKWDASEITRGELRSKATQVKQALVDGDMAKAQAIYKRDLEPAKKAIFKDHPDERRTYDLAQGAYSKRDATGDEIAEAHTARMQAAGFYSRPDFNLIDDDNRPAADERPHPGPDATPEQIEAWQDSVFEAWGETPPAAA
ncbi:MAG: hypothetical protein OXC10_20950 [Rhodospirillaceae bacterium]|nr:hypothetical protein [Rhodospirillaceae bacterium]